MVGIYDCNGACADISYLSWVGDGFCDATGYGDNTPGYGLNFLCEEYNFDLGDCDSYLDCTTYTLVIAQKTHVEFVMVITTVLK